MTLYRATILDTPRSPFEDEPARSLAADADGGIVVTDGIISARGGFAEMRSVYPDQAVVDLSGGLLVPGFVDTHVHYPQMRSMAGLGMPLLDWLDRCALPEEARFADKRYAAAVADEFLRNLVSCGTTAALVFGAHFAAAMEEFFSAAERSGLSISTGLVLSDRIVRPDLRCTPESGIAQSRTLVDRWHGVGRLRYAVTPRFSLFTTDKLLAGCAELLDGDPGDIALTTHINENSDEVRTVGKLFPSAKNYLDTYDMFGLVTERSVFAHNVHPTDAELSVLGERRAWISHCPTSNAALGSGIFSLRRHVEAGVQVALGCDVGAGTGLFLLKEGLQAYFLQQLLGSLGIHGLALTPVHLLYLSTLAGARAIGRGDRIGDFSPGKDFDAVWLRPAPGSQYAINLANAADPIDALARTFALATPADIAGVWLQGRRAVGEN